MLLDMLMATLIQSKVVALLARLRCIIFGHISLARALGSVNMHV